MSNLQFLMLMFILLIVIVSLIKNKNAPRFAGVRLHNFSLLLLGIQDAFQTQLLRRDIMG